MGQFQNIRSLINANRLDEALAEADSAVERDPADAGALFIRGRIYWKKGLRREAVNDYTAAAAIDPDGPAAIALAQVREINDFFNPDIFNP